MKLQTGQREVGQDSNPDFFGSFHFTGDQPHFLGTPVLAGHGDGQLTQVTAFSAAAESHPTLAHL